ncbi:MAG: uracil-DNA glycosylase [Burkholderia sp.]|nr:MAG: hypothetical protein E5299_00862 [Burkholderia gladioli]
MSWRDSALDEMGLGPRWVWRGQRAAQVTAGEAQAGAVVTMVSSETITPPATADRIGDQGSDEKLPPEDAHVERSAPGRELLRPALGATCPSSSATKAMVARTSAVARAARGAPANKAFSFDDPSWFNLVPDAPPPGLVPVPPVQRSAAASSIDDLAWSDLEARVAECQRCRLCEKRTQTVFGVGDREADWMLVGEAPGENEDRQGKPFVGQAGKLLDSMLHALSLERGNNVYIANVIKCRPPGNRNPEPDEVARCEPYLQRQVALIKPKLIVALGRFAAQTLLKSDGSIASMRGRVQQYESVPVIVSYHPAYLLRSLPDKSKAWADLCLARATFSKATGAYD